MKAKLIALWQNPQQRAKILRLLSYAVIGAIATLVEWLFYYLFDPGLHFNTYIAVALAFVFSTFANWAGGRLLTFRHAPRQNVLRELGEIYAAAGIGLLLNEFIMWLLMHWLFTAGTDWQKMLAKVTATAVVFFWNYFVRVRVIYKLPQGPA
ncbi:MAG: GtrA family protein [Oscillospiraceae bacterium]|nr:GtrA family protein [Oscillospiraceae bacterium]MDD4368458.1 GtrA family protein [Oscillospiraceae bacterium]